MEPSSWHYYQPLRTLVGAGCATPEASGRDQARVMPRGVPGPTTEPVLCNNSADIQLSLDRKRANEPCGHIPVDSRPTTRYEHSSPTGSKHLRAHLTSGRVVVELRQTAESIRALDVARARGVRATDTPDAQPLVHTTRIDHWG